MITHIHHVNFLVHDLNRAITQYTSLLGGATFERDELSQRSVQTARAKVGDTWLILVQPTDADSVPARHLAQYGEGFFLLSLATDDIDSEQQRITRDTDIEFQTPERRGLDNWRVRDMPVEAFFGAQLQLTQEDVNEE